MGSGEGHGGCKWASGNQGRHFRVQVRALGVRGWPLSLKGQILGVMGRPLRGFLGG